MCLPPERLPGGAIAGELQRPLFRVALVPQVSIPGKQILELVTSTHGSCVMAWRYRWQAVSFSALLPPCNN